MNAKDATQDVLAAIAHTRRLIDAEKALPEGERSESYISDLEAHIDKLKAALAKHADRKERDEALYGKPS